MLKPEKKEKGVGVIGNSIPFLFLYDINKDEWVEPIKRALIPSLLYNTKLITYPLGWVPVRVMHRLLYLLILLVFPNVITFRRIN